MQDLTLFKKYKSQFLSLCFVLGGIFIIFMVIVPNVGNSVEQQKKNTEQSEKLKEINLSIQLIQSSEDTALEENLGIVVDALPAAKDVTAIYTSLTSAAASSGVFFEGFTVSPGSIYGTETEKVQGIPSVAVSARISNVSNESLIEFLGLLSRNSPLSEVKEISLSGGTADVELLFFYKPYDLSVINSEIVKPLSSVEEEIIENLREAN